MGSARQLIVKMTAGLKPRRLVVHHQRGVVVLEFEIKQNISLEITEPLLSQIVWWKGMADIKKIRLNEWVWEALDVLRIKTVPDYPNQTIRVAVMIRTRIDDSDEGLSELFGKVAAFDYPRLEYVFGVEEELKPNHQMETAENNNDGPSTVIQVQFRSAAAQPPTRRTS